MTSEAAANTNGLKTEVMFHLIFFLFAKPRFSYAHEFVSTACFRYLHNLAELWLSAFLNLLSPNSDEHQISPHHISAL